MTKRRDFIKKGVMGTAGMAIGGMGFTAKSYASVVGANDRINVALVGLRGRGTAHIDEWCLLKETHNVRLISLCDVDEQFFAERSATVQEKSGVKPSLEWDMHKVISNPDIHVVFLCHPQPLACAGSHLGMSGR